MAHLADKGSIVKETIMPPMAINSGGGGSITDIMARLQAEQNKANAANQLRADQGMQIQQGQYGKSHNLYGSALNDIAGEGQAEHTRIDRNLQKNLGASQQGLISRGLGNSTITDAVSRGYRDDAQLEHQGVSEGVGRMQSGIHLGQAGFENQAGQQFAGFLERQNDVGPDASLYASLMHNATGSQNLGPVQGTQVNPYGSPSGLTQQQVLGHGAAGGGGASTGGGSSGGGGYYNGGGGGGGRSGGGGGSGGGQPGSSSGGGHNDYSPDSGNGYFGDNSLLPQNGFNYFGGDGSTVGNAGGITGALSGGDHSKPPAGGAAGGASASAAGDGNVFQAADGSWWRKGNSYTGGDIRIS